MSLDSSVPHSQLIRGTAPIGPGSLRLCGTVQRGNIEEHITCTTQVARRAHGERLLRFLLLMYDAKQAATHRNARCHPSGRRSLCFGAPAFIHGVGSLAHFFSVELRESRNVAIQHCVGLLGDIASALHFGE